MPEIQPAILSVYDEDGKEIPIPAIVGQKGEDGKPGSDGISPHIGENGNWFVGSVDTNTCAQGEQGESGVHYGTNPPTDPNQSVWVKPDGEPEGTVVIDPTLTKPGQAADAKATGDALARKADVEGEWEFVKELTITEPVASITENTLPDGTPYNLKMLRVECVAPKSATVNFGVIVYDDNDNAYNVPSGAKSSNNSSFLFHPVGNRITGSVVVSTGQWEGHLWGKVPQIGEAKIPIKEVRLKNFTGDNLLPKDTTVKIDAIRM